MKVRPASRPDIPAILGCVRRIKNEYFEDSWWYPPVIIDVGISRDENGKLCGDVDKEVYDLVGNVTPVPGGVGLYTRVSLLENTIYGRSHDK